MDLGDKKDRTKLRNKIKDEMLGGSIKNKTLLLCALLQRFLSLAMTVSLSNGYIFSKKIKSEDKVF